MKPATHLTRAEAAARLRRTPQTLANWASNPPKGGGPPFIPGRPALYPIAELDAWERRRLVGSTLEAELRAVEEALS